MLAAGTVIEVQLPGHEAVAQATVLSCSSTMVSVRLQEIGSQAVHRVSLKKLPYTIVSQPPEPLHQLNAAAAAAGGSADFIGLWQPDNVPEQQQAAGGPMHDLDLQEHSHAPSLPQYSLQRHDGPTPMLFDAFPACTGAAIEAFMTAVELNPAAFLQPTAELVARAKAAVKAVYDYHATLECSQAGAAFGSRAAGVLPELYVDGFDAEQIWLQLDLAIVPALNRARKLLKKAGGEPQLFSPEMGEAIADLLGEQEGFSLVGQSDDDSQEELLGAEGSVEEAGEQIVTADLAHVDYDALLATGKARLLPQLQRADQSELHQEEHRPVAGMKRKRSADRSAAVRTEVEDEHFKLDEMEAFVQQAEQEAASVDEDGQEGADSDIEEAEVMALLKHRNAKSGKHASKAKKLRKRIASYDIDSGDESEDLDGENIGAKAMYEDFFGPRSGRQQGAVILAAGNKNQVRDKMSSDEDSGKQLGDEEEQSSDFEGDGFEDDLLDDDLLSEEEHADAGQPIPAPHEQIIPEGVMEDFWDGASARMVPELLSASHIGDEENADLEPSAHQRRQQRMQEKIRKLEEAAIGSKEWFMLGEVDAVHRPKNSALEIDMDFETTVKPPPQPTEEMTRTLDELIKARVAEGRFDDVMRIVMPLLETKRTTLALDDGKPQQGLGEQYEQEYMKAVTGAADDKDEEVRRLARAQFSELCFKLDALCHLHFTPRPVIDEVTVKVDVPAIMMEEAAPQFMSGASMRAPEEVFVSQAGGAPKAEEELGREERKRRRAQKKRAGQKRRESKEEERAARAAAAGGAVLGRKSEVAQGAARKTQSRNRAPRRSKKSEFSRSKSVFAEIEQRKEGMAPQPQAPQAAQLKL